jgi:hypothetical protein
MLQTDVDAIFHLPLSQHAYDEFLELQDWLQHINYDPMAVDVWMFQWGNNKYSSRKFYQLAFQQLEAHPIFTWLWKSGCTPRVKFFGWLILVDRLNTETMLRHTNLNVGDNDAFCILCIGNCEEDVDHLFFGCDFAKRCWSAVGIQWDITLGLFQWLALAKTQCNLPFFTELVLIAVGNSGSCGMIKSSIGEMLALIFGSVILKINVCFSLSVSRKTLGHPFATGSMQSVSDLL